MKQSIKLIAISELLIVATSLFSFSFFINLQIAFLSSLFIILGSSYAYRKMVDTQVASDMVDEKRDILDEIEDPHELYEEDSINYAPVEELDLRAIVKEEKKKIKTFSLESMKHGAKGSSSLFRLVPYLFLVLGFIALKNNQLLDIAIYLPSLLVGIVIGSMSGKELFSIEK
ncbi:hypothetical protein [Sulfurimonas sp.]|uniref:hypothetical protein n=1 Tax=Sulfurimonas sp. TaxID=2022749 RepID=UPI003568B829